MKAGELKVELKQEEALWYDRKRVTVFALPLSFTKYTLTPTRLIVESGFLNKKEDEIKLYRVTDVEYSQTLFERIGGVGTIRLLSNDTSSPEMKLLHIKNAKEVKEAISYTVEHARKDSGVRTSEMVGSMHHDEEGCPICE